MGRFHYGPGTAQGRTAPTRTDHRPDGEFGSVLGCDRNSPSVTGSRVAASLSSRSAPFILFSTPSGRCSLLVRPQLPAEHLADHRLRERVAELDQLRYVVAGQPLA